MTLIPIALLALVVAGCESDVRAAGNASDALAEDSTLALEVYGARPDSAPVIGDDPVVASEAIVAVDDVPVTQAQPARRVLRPQSEAPVIRPATVRRSTPRTRVKSTTAKTPRSSAVVSRSPRSRISSVAERPVSSRIWLTLPVGADLEFKSSQQVCSADAGDAFVATLSEDVVAANGVIIPDGATARGEIVSTSSDKPSMRIRWITFNGRMYAVNTRITHADTKRGRSKTNCIPDGGRIVAELTEPLRILLSE